MTAQDLDYLDIDNRAGWRRRFYYRPASRTDQAVIEQVFKYQHYSLANVALAASLRSYGDAAAAGGAALLAVDLGANIGASSVYLTQIDPRIHVCALEPEPDNFAVLAANSAGLPITPIPAAIASKPGRLWLSDPGSGEWGFQVGGPSGVRQVDAITMSDVLARFDKRRYAPLICKIDIEGSERELFSANDAWVDRFPLIMIELHDWMLPGTGSNFFAAMARRNVNLVNRDETVLCFNNDLLAPFRPPKN